MLMLGVVAATVEVEVVAGFAFETCQVAEGQRLVVSVIYSKAVVGKSSGFWASFYQIAVTCHVSTGHGRSSWKV